MRPRFRDRVIVGALFAVVALSADARPIFAQSAEDKAASRPLAEEGIAAFRAGQYAVAVEKLERAQQLFPAPVPLLYLARAQIALGKLVEAAETLRSLERMDVGKGASAAAKQAVTDGHGELAQLEPRIPSVKVVVEPADAADLELSIDGQKVSSAVVGVDRPTDPGSHVVRAQARGFAPAEATVELREGRHETVKLALRAGTGDASVAAPPAPASSPKKPAGMHDGFMARLAIGGGTFNDSFELEGLQFFGLNAVDGKATGPSVSGELTLTWGLKPGWLLGGGVFSEQVASPKITVQGKANTDISVGTLGLVGAYLDWYPDATGGLHFALAAGAARITIKDASGNTSNNAPAGGGGALCAGYEFRLGDSWAIGAHLRLLAAGLSADGLHHTVTVPSLLLSIAYD